MNHRFVLLLAFLTTLPTACSSGANDGSSAAASASTPPPGCAKTLCDIERAGCTNTPPPVSACSSCFNQCTDPSTAYECASVCNDICAQPSDPTPPPDPCADALAACRKTPHNGICADAIASAGPNGEPCGDVLSRAACACGDDQACDDAIYASKPACRTCDNGWMSKCVTAACADVNKALGTCLNAHQCTSLSPYCRVSCPAEIAADDKCFQAAISDPRDPGGCYSGSHECWSLPVCQPDGSATK